MAPATRYECLTCKRSFIKDFLNQENYEYVCCSFFGVISKISGTLEIIDTRIAKFEAANISVVIEKDIGEKDWESVNNESVVQINQMEDRITKLEKNDFQRVKRGSKIERGASYSGVVMRNRFLVLEDEVRDEPGVILVGDSLIRRQDEEFCLKGPMRKNFCYPGKKVENITDKIDELVVNSSEETVCVYQVGTNNVDKDRSEEVYEKYKKD